jgi:hypothetical protein
MTLARQPATGCRVYINPCHHRCPHLGLLTDTDTFSHTQPTSFNNPSPQRCVLCPASGLLVVALGFSISKIIYCHSQGKEPLLATPAPGKVPQLVGFYTESSNAILVLVPELVVAGVPATTMALSHLNLRQARAAMAMGGVSITNLIAFKSLNMIFSCYIALKTVTTSLFVGVMVNQPIDFRTQLGLNLLNGIEMASILISLLINNPEAQVLCLARTGVQCTPLPCTGVQCIALPCTRV